MKKEQLKRFFAKIDKNGPKVLHSRCWLWTASKTGSGYGQVTVDKRPGKAHRFSYELKYGPIPTGLQIDHLCRNRACVNPDHLEAVTPKENVRRSVRYDPTHCVNGHEFNAANTLIVRGKHRHCRACDRDRKRKAKGLDARDFRPWRLGKSTHCKAGHEFSEENTRFTKRGRVCRECERITWRRNHGPTPEKS